MVNLGKRLRFIPTFRHIFAHCWRHEQTLESCGALTGENIFLPTRKRHNPSTLRTWCDTEQKCIEWARWGREARVVLTSPRSCSCWCCHCWTPCWAAGSCSSSARPPCQSLCSSEWAHLSPSYFCPLDEREENITMRLPETVDVTVLFPEMLNGSVAQKDSCEILTQQSYWNLLFSI